MLDMENAVEKQLLYGAKDPLQRQLFEHFFSLPSPKLTVRP